MNWTETIMINDDLCTPLNKKAEMISGVWPRNCVFTQKQFTRNHSGADENFALDTPGELFYEIEGRGIISELSIAAGNAQYYNGDSGYWYDAPANTSQAVVVVDDVQTFFVSASKLQTSSFSVDITNLYPSVPVIAGGDLSEVTINDTILFKENFKLYIRFSGWATSYGAVTIQRGATATIKYGLY